MTKSDPILHPHNFKDLTGQVFYWLTVLSYKNTNGKRGKHASWLCRCICGNFPIISGEELRNGDTRSCGCLALKIRTKHGRIKTKTYVAWQSAKRRCFGKNCRDSKNYSDRGISMCARWKNDFNAFLKDMGDCPPGLTLDRFPDNGGNYEPGNCRWATYSEQARNTRKTVIITFNGLTLPRAAWTEQLGFKPDTLRDRLRRGWSLDRAMSTPESHR